MKSPLSAIFAMAMIAAASIRPAPATGASAKRPRESRAPSVQPVPASPGAGKPWARRKKSKTKK